MLESSIITVTGHKSTRGYKSYNPGDQSEFRGMSNALKLSGTNQSTSSSLQNASKSSGVENKPTYAFHSCTLNFNNISQKVKSSWQWKFVIYGSDSS